MDLEGAYRLYAGRLFAYAKGILGDHHSAADVVQETFLLASQRAGQLRDPAALSSWLYTITRRESLRHLKTRARLFPVESLPEQADAGTDPLAAARDAEIGELVWAAYGGLVANDREIIELSVRHGLSAVEIATVLRFSVKHANARISRARASMTQALGVLLVARAPGECAELAQVLGGWDGKLTVLLRKRLHRHIEGCHICSGEQKRRMDPAAILSGYAALPFLAFAETQRSGRPTSRFPARTIVIVGAVLLLIVTGIPLALAQRNDPKPAAVPTVFTSVAPAATGQPSGQPTVDPPAGSPKPPAPQEFKATAQILQTVCAGENTYAFSIRVVTTGPLIKAILLWQAGGGPVYWDDMTLSPSKLEGKGAATGSSTQPIKWWVKASGADGSTAHSETVVSANPCA